MKDITFEVTDEVYEILEFLADIQALSVEKFVTNYLDNISASWLQKMECFIEKKKSVSEEEAKKVIESCKQLGLTFSQIGEKTGVDSLDLVSYSDGSKAMSWKIYHRLVSLLHDIESQVSINDIKILKQYRELKHITQEALAAQLGVPQTAISKWERGEIGMPKSVYNKAMTFLRMWKK